MNDLTIFENPDFGTVRTIEQDGKVLFCGKDVAEALGYKRPADAISAHCKGVCELPTPTAGGVQKMKYVSEGDIYRLAAKSELPGADKFESWIFDEVLPTIRKHGAYMTAEARQTEYITRLEAEAKATRARAMLINAENRRMKMLLNYPEMGKLSQHALETLALKTFEQATGQDVGNVLPVVEQTYSATEVGEMLGGISANKIGKTANAHGLKTEEYGELVMDKSRYSSKQMPSFRYNRRGVEKLAEILGVAVIHAA